MDKNKSKPRKRIHNPRTGKYYAVRQRSSTKGRKGTIKGLWKPPTKRDRLQGDVTNNAFFFYKDVDQPTGESAHSISEFKDKIKSIDIESIEFHIERGDFESWIRFMGNNQIERRVKQIKEEHNSGEELREKLCEAMIG